MKKVYAVFCLALLAFFSLNSLSIEQQPNSITKFRVLESTSTQTTLEFSLPEFKVVTKELNGSAFNKIEAECDGFTPEAGLPELPIYSTMIAIPYHGSVSMEIVGQNSYTIDNYSAYPVQEENRSFAFDNEFYNGDSSYPQQGIQLSEPGIIRDFRVVSVSFIPFVYNPSTRSLVVTSNLTCRLNYSNESGVNEMEAPESYSPSFQPIYQSLIANYEQVFDRTIPVHNKRLLIIYGGSTDQQYLDKLDEFVQWKRQKGYKVTTASTTIIGTTTVAIKDYIQMRYNNTYTRPEYVLLIGDTSGSVHIDCWTVGGGASDYPYTQLAGGDTMGDVFIGRMPAENTVNFLTMANKVFTYEMDTAIEPTNWYNQILLVGNTNWVGQSTLNLAKYLKGEAMENNQNYNFTELYGSPSSTSMTATINSGVSLFLYSGFIGMNGWDSPTEASFTNSHKMPHCIFNAPATGNFNSTDASDMFVRFGTPAMPKGGITAIGVSNALEFVSETNIIPGGIIDGIFNLGYSDMSAPLLYGKLSMYEIYNAIASNYTVNYPAWFNLMGDPTVEVFIGTPGTLIAEYPASVQPGETIYPVHVEDEEGNPMEGAVVTLVNDGFQIISESDANGNTLFTLPANLSEGEIFTVTISQHDFVPVFENIMVTTTDGIVVTEVYYDDSLNGNNDGNADAGETLYLSISLTNPGTTTITDAEVELTSQDPYISITQNSCNYGDIAPGAVAVCNAAYEIHIDANTPDSYEAVLKLQVVGEDYSTCLSVQVNNAELNIESVVVLNTNQVLEAGQTANFALNLFNNGSNALNGIQVELSTESTLISITDGYAYFGTAPLEGTITNMTDALTVTADDILFAGAYIEVTAHIFNDSGYSKYETFILPTGEPTIECPTGPDRFGHYVYHSSDANVPAIAEYNWIGIAPAEGGSGNQFTSISDESSDNDTNYDQVGADTIDHTTLPFTFTFYGVDYDEVYVCSNGFLTFVPTEYGGPQNMPIPGILSASPVIAPFWDNLEYHNGGGIYHWRDLTNHLFIIEWYQARNSWDGTSQETFQVIFYDPEFYPTSNGDGMFKIQYQTFNDVDAPNNIVYPPIYDLYSTIGFGDHTNTDGITYLFDQDYAEAGQPITNGTALLISGEYNLESTSNNSDEMPAMTARLYANYPNPFNPLTNISYSLSVNGFVSLDIYNVRGQHIRNLVKDVQSAGEHVVQWNGKDSHNKECASGLYLYRLRTGEVNITKKAILLK
ncbi:MAG: T9SS type A sorting domain-containing protein [Candidatus Cloacimonetes bacterium]|nr:T9SS type A sorting domain-containing protein [Candidatus Cloacimonadota bacterium]